MWKKLIFLFLVIGLLVILIGCGGGNPVVPPGDETTTDEEFTAILDNGENAIDKFEEYCNSIGEEQAYQATVDFLEQQDGVKEAGIGKDGTTIWFECENGYLVGILSTEEEEKGNKKGIEIPFDQSKVTPSAEKALILNPGFNIIGTLKAQRIKGKLNSLYGDYDYESGSDVSIELMKELYQYSVIYMITHGGFIKDYLSFCLKIEATTDIKNQYDGYLKDHYLTIGYVENPITKKRKPYISITPLFIKNKNSGTFPDSLICIDACHSLEDTTMAKVFLDKGAYAYCGYTTTMEFGYDTPVDFFDNLISKKMNVEDALDDLSNANNFDYYPKNPINHGDLYLVEDDETKIENVFYGIAQAFNDKDWDKVRSYCVYGSVVYNEINELEQAYYNNPSDVADHTVIHYVSPIIINGQYAEAYVYLTSVFIYNGEVEEFTGEQWQYLQKIGNDWKVYDYSNEQKNSLFELKKYLYFKVGDTISIKNNLEDEE